MSRHRHTILNTLVRDSEPSGRLARTCRATLDSFFNESKVSVNGWVVHEGVPGKSSYWRERYAFKDNGASILAVAHCDTVWENVYPYKLDLNELKVHTPELDDRLGVYLINHLLPTLGVRCDVLLTENEEFCDSTAKDFATDKKYNWIFEWDRRGSGVVMYQYETPELKEMMQKFDFKVEPGTYSDIADLYTLGVAGFNFATGYANEHTKNCFVDLRCLSKQVVKFMRFYSEYKDTLIESKAGTRYSSRYTWRYSGREDDYDDYYNGYGSRGYYDKEGKWHYYGSTSATSASGRYSSYKPVSNKKVYAKCVNCGEKSRIKTSYNIRGKYLCPTCEHSCKSCGHLYSISQIDAISGFCFRCKAMLDAISQKPENYRVCITCKTKFGCTEVWTDTWVCYDCLWSFFTTCDECHGVMPAVNVGSQKNAAVGICKVCAGDKKDGHGWMACDGCGEVKDVDEIVFFPNDKLHLCSDCSYTLYDMDDDEESEKADYVVDRAGNAVPSNNVVGYDYCDICGMRDELFDVDDLNICNICRTRMDSPGL